MLCQMSRQGSDLGPGGLSGSEGGAGSVLRKRALTHSSSGIILLVLVVMMIGDNEELILDNVPQALTRFSISRKSREEMVHFFIS